MKSTTQKIVLSSLFAALICVATFIIVIPASAVGGYLNLGDGFVLTAAWTLSPLFGCLAAAIGSALADVFSSYFIYAPATFFIKGAMALVAFSLFKFLNRRYSKPLSALLSGFAAEVLMVLGYFLYEGILYGFIPSLVNIPFNAIQGAVGLVVALLLRGILSKTKFTF